MIDGNTFECDECGETEDAAKGTGLPPSWSLELHDNRNWKHVCPYCALPPFGFMERRQAKPRLSHG